MQRGANGMRPSCSFARQLLAEPGHRAIEVMKIKPLDAGDPVVLAPAIRGAVGAADRSPMQGGEEHSPLQRKTVLAKARVCTVRDPGVPERPARRSAPTAASVPQPSPER